MWRNLGSWSYILAMVWLTWLMLGLSLPYLSGARNVDFLLTKQRFVYFNYYYYPFLLHVCTSIFALVAGAFQFSGYLITRQKKLHRFLGLCYVFTVLLLSGPSGLVISCYANGGFFVICSFLLLSILWIFFTFRAFQLALKKRFEAHARFMLLSYALTLSAITLRLYQWLAEVIADPDPVTSYQIASILSWTLNLAIAGLLIRMGWHKKLLTP